jgi:RHS repeat-associated protein
MGRETSVSKTITGDLTVYTSLHSYDLSGKLISTTYPDNYQVNNYYYPGTGLLSSVLGITDFMEYAKLTGYQPTGKIGQMDHGNNTSTIYTYDPKSTRLTAIVSKDSSQIDLQNRAYGYSPAGDIEQIIDNKNITYTYGYDYLHRLTSETNTGSYDPITYTYNAVGNITFKTVGTNTYNYTYADSSHKHAVSSINYNGNNYNYTYDDNGNITGGPDFSNPGQVNSRSITFSADNMPTVITHDIGGTTHLTYDGSGNRAKKSVQGGGTTYYVGEHYEVINGTATKYIFAGNLRIAMVSTAGTSYFHKDHLGSSTVMTDAAGLTVETTIYMPFGHMRAHTGTVQTNYKFTDQELDPESGLYNYGARLYDPMIGRFISPDTIVQNPSDPQTLNRYSYCRNNPLIYIDPMGYGFFSKIAKVFKHVVKGIGKTIERAVHGDIKAIATVAISAVSFWVAGEIIGVLNAPSLESFYVVTGTTAIENAAIHAAAGAFAGGMTSAINGGDIGKGI